MKQHPKRFLLLTILFVLAATLTTTAQTYLLTGAVGKLAARFTLSVVSSSRGTKIIKGTYYYVKRPAVVYGLEGAVRNKTLQLNEYTLNGQQRATVSARVFLTGSFASGFRGEMNNTDGRTFSMFIDPDN